MKNKKIETVSGAYRAHAAILLGPREAARKAKEVKYFSGIACRWGHLSERYAATGGCLECQVSQTLERRLKVKNWRISRANQRKADRAEAVCDQSGDRWKALERERKIREWYSYYRHRQPMKVEIGPIAAMVSRIRALLGVALRKRGLVKNSRSEVMLGCTWKEFARHIEKQFLQGMTWENRSLWHLDHITPISLAVTLDDVIALSHFTNLRPLWAKDNIRKSNKITHLI